VIKNASAVQDFLRSGINEDPGWLDAELQGSRFKDLRLGKRLRQFMGNLWSGVGMSIPFACQDWANTKAAYRFLDNENVSESEILEGHFQSTAERFAATEGLVLVLQDTTEFSYKREKPEAIGVTHKAKTAQMDGQGRPMFRTQCGILMHSNLVVTTQGLPLGLAAIKFWTRDKFKGCNALKKSINQTRMPIEEKESYRWIENLRMATQRLGDPARCVHVGDRENDIYEFFCEAEKLNTHFVVRVCTDRLAGDGKQKISDEMKCIPIQKLHKIEVRDKKGKLSQATLELTYHRLTVLPPIGKQKKYPALRLTFIHAKERGKPDNRDAIDWKLMTNLPVVTDEAAIEKLNWYALRWKIETFHKILKSCGKAEDSKLRTADRLTNLIAINCILSWRLFWLTMISRSDPDLSPDVALTPTEIQLLDHLVAGKSRHTETKNLASYVIKIAMLGGYLARNNDPPPGNLVIWRGLNRLADITLGIDINEKLVGN
jgi:hypothetical protein